MTNRPGVVEVVGDLIALIVILSATFIVTSYFYASRDIWEARDKENFIVDNAWFVSRSGRKFVNVSIYNYGTVDTRIKAIYVGNSFWFSDTVIRSSSRVWANVNFTWTRGTTYLVKIVSERGNSYERFWTASNATA